MLNVGAVQRVVCCPQLFELFPGVHILQSGKELSSWTFHKTDDPTKLTFEADDATGEKDNIQ